MKFDFIQNIFCKTKFPKVFVQLCSFNQPPVKMVKNYGALPTSSRKDLGVKDFQTSGSILPEIEIKG